MEFIKKAATAAAIAVITTFAVFAATPHYPAAAATIARLAPNGWTWAAIGGAIAGTRLLFVRWGFDEWDWSDANCWFQLVTVGIALACLAVAALGVSRITPLL